VIYKIEKIMNSRSSSYIYLEEVYYNIMKKLWKYAIPLLVLALLLSALPACSSGGTDKTEIVIGASRDISGPQAGFQTFGAAPIYKMWIDDVNAAGGIKVGSKSLKVRLIEYDDASDTAACVRNIEKLCTVDKVDFLFGPTGTAMLFAAAPIANKYKKIILCMEGGATTLESKLGGMPYVFSPLNYSNHFQMPVFVDLCVAKQAKTAFVIAMNDLHGAEYNTAFQGEAALKGITVVDSVTIPVTITDMNSVVQAAKAANPDIVCVFAYPNQNILFMNTAMALNFSPKILLIGPGCNFGFFNLTYGAALEGVIGEGAWNAKSSPKAAAFATKAEVAVGGPGNMDWWGAIVYYSAAEFLGQAITKAGSLDNEKVRAVMYKEKFETTIGTFYWQRLGDDGGCLMPQDVYDGQIGQWQKGVFEVIDPDKHNTAAMEYPKPAWPAK
jgi:branched-chain amino acid transport system substrate-binding protein